MSAVGGPTERIAEVSVDVPLPHLDRPFDYLVPTTLPGAESPDAVGPGMRVKVPFAGRDRDGWVLRVRDATEEDAARRLAPLRRLVSPVATLTPTVLALARVVADRYAGSLPDVVRFAVPPRHARAEAGVLAALQKRRASGAETGDGEAEARDGEREAKTSDSEGRRSAADDAGEPPTPADLDPAGWRDITGGEALLRRLADGEAPRAVWTHTGTPAAARDMLVAAASATRAAGRSVLIVVPDVRDVDRVVPALAEALKEEVVRLVASDGPSVRARAHLRALTGLARIVVGTRSAAWAPLPDLGLLVCWDDGDDSLAEQRAPYPHAAQVLALRAEPERAALLLGSVSRSTWAQHLVATGWAVSLRGDRAVVRRTAPRVTAPDAEDLERAGPGGAARIPTPAWRAVKDALERGPVLVQAPRAGYVPHLVCARCREIARCPACGGSLAATDAAPAPVCGTCGTVAEGWTCPECHGHRLRAMRVGAQRTAEELGRAFPQTPVVVSEAARGVVADVDERPRIVVATPGSEPEAASGYAAAVLLDGALATSLPGLSGGEEAVRRWLHAASLVRSAHDGGRVVLTGGGDARVLQTLVRWDPVTFAERDLAERRELRFPPTVRAVALTGELGAVTDLLMEIELPDGAELLGPFPAPVAGEDEGVDTVRAVLRAPLQLGPQLSAAVRAGLGVRSAHKRAGSVRVVVDPRDM
ncbi:primosomal protein N' family DNA-binding protein [Miniimonas arenae]|uniref:primosomal protein N' family DNA-binding protein n=1 Tax=Miniimonas arenae TaxID=676201 RepID=UPI0028A9C01F|nr:primosomal protein N' [Miniimonas arenae]